MVIVVRKYHQLPHHYHIPYIFMFITQCVNDISFSVWRKDEKSAS